MTSEHDEFVWACGLFEGEGWITSGRRAMGLGMIDREVVERFQRAVGIGPIYTSHLRNGTPMYTWNLGGWERVTALLNRMLPLLGSRRRAQADRLFANPPQFKLDPERAKQVNDLASQGWMQGDIAEAFGISRPLVTAIRAGRCWSSVTGVEKR